MQAALEMMGFRTYKSIDLGFYLPELVRNASAGTTLAPSSLAGSLRSCGVRAIAPEPLHALTPQLVRSSPGVKVIFTWRDWQRLHSSSRRALLSAWLLADVLAPLLCDWMPYGAAWPNGDPGHSFLDTSLSSLLVDHCCRAMMRIRPAYGRFSPHMNSKNLTERKTAVLEYHSHLKQLVDPEAFLDFDYDKHGWSTLEAFLGVPAPSGSTPFPRLRSKTISRVALKWRMDPWKYSMFFLILLATVVANMLVYFCLVGLLRRLTRRAFAIGRLKSA